MFALKQQILDATLSVENIYVRRCCQCIEIRLVKHKLILLAVDA